MIELNHDAFEKALRAYREHNKSGPEPYFDNSWAYGFTPRGENHDHTVVVLRGADDAELCRVNIDDLPS